MTSTTTPDLLPKGRGIRLLPSGNWQVQKTVLGRNLRGTFETLETALEYADAVDEAAARGSEPPTGAEWLSPARSPAPVDCPRRIDDLVQHTIDEGTKRKKRDTQSAADSISRWMNGPAAFFENMRVDLISEDMVWDFRDFMQDPDGLDYAPSTTNKRLGYLKRALDLAVRRQLIATNVASEVTAYHVPDEDDVPRSPLTFREMQAFAAQFPPDLRLVPWLLFLMCLRIGEVFGVELRDWDSSNQLLWVRRQGGKATARSEEARGSTTKTPAGRRQLPVPDALAGLIDDYIDRFHEPRPDDASELLEWGSRRLIRTARSKRPWQVVIRRRWNRALNDAGLGQQERGYRITTHYLRKSGSSWIGLKLPGPEWSRFMGHKVTVTGVSTVTIADYFKLPQEQLFKISALLQEYVEHELGGELDSGQEWTSDDYLTATEAAEVLNCGIASVSRYRTIGKLVTVPSAAVPVERYGEVSRNDRVLVTRSSVEQVLSDRDAHADYCSVEEAMRVLNVGRRFVNNLITQGHLGEVTRVGGAYRLEVVRLDICAEAIAQERAALGPVLSVSQAAAKLGRSETFVRYQVRAGLLPATNVMGFADPRYRIADLDSYARERALR